MNRIFDPVLWRITLFLAWLLAGHLFGHRVCGCGFPAS